MIRVLIATTNAGKLRDFAGAASPLGIEIESLPNFASIPTAVEDGLTFVEVGDSGWIAAAQRREGGGVGELVTIT